MLLFRLNRRSLRVTICNHIVHEECLLRDAIGEATARVKGLSIIGNRGVSSEEALGNAVGGSTGGTSAASSASHSATASAVSSTGPSIVMAAAAADSLQTDNVTSGSLGRVERDNTGIGGIRCPLCRL